MFQRVKGETEGAAFQTQAESRPNKKSEPIDKLAGESWRETIAANLQTCSYPACPLEYPRPTSVYGFHEVP